MKIIISCSTNLVFQHIANLTWLAYDKKKAIWQLIGVKMWSECKDLDKMQKKNKLTLAQSIFS